MGSRPISAQHGMSNAPMLSLVRGLCRFPQQALSRDFWRFT